jgi:transposase
MSGEIAAASRHPLWRVSGWDGLDRPLSRRRSSPANNCWPTRRNLPHSLIGIEACSGAHFTGAALRNQGHDVRLIAAQFVKPFVKSNKNDFINTEAIADAVSRQNMRFMELYPLRPPKTARSR